MKRYGWVAVGLVIAVSASVSVIQAFSNGATAGFSGGPLGYTTGGGNCNTCHDFNAGPGGVELIGAPRRYRPGASYDLTVRVFDSEQLGAGFEISAEGAGGHLGTFTLVDPVETKNADFTEPIHYVTHTMDGFLNSLSQWSANGNAYAFHTRWNAPTVDEGPVTLFVAGNAVDHAGNFFVGDRYYAAHATLPAAADGDGDGDGDSDLQDFALLQRCLGDGPPWIDPACEGVDFDSDNIVSLSDLGSYLAGRTGPTASVPAGYALADAVRGGLLYDKWWIVNGAAPPTGNHPLYPAIGVQSGASTFRCKECHGWDYKGVDGAYGTGSHFTGIRGVFGTTLTPQALFDLLTSDDSANGGHDMDALGMSDADLWDVVKMTLEQTIDTDLYIDAQGAFRSSRLLLGQSWYDAVCSSCHGNDGTNLNFGTAGAPEFVGTVAGENPWEFLHKSRFGQPDTSMPSLDLLHWDRQRVTDIGAFAQTLPP